MNGVMNGIVSGDGEYQAILRKSDVYSCELDRMDLSKEIRLQGHVFGKYLPTEVKENEHGTVTAKCRTGRKGCGAAIATVAGQVTSFWLLCMLSEYP